MKSGSTTMSLLRRMSVGCRLSRAPRFVAPAKPSLVGSAITLTAGKGGVGGLSGDGQGTDQGEDQGENIGQFSSDTAGVGSVSVTGHPRAYATAPSSRFRAHVRHLDDRNAPGVSPRAWGGLRRPLDQEHDLEHP